MDKIKLRPSAGIAGILAVLSAILITATFSYDAKVTDLQDQLRAKTVATDATIYSRDMEVLDLTGELKRAQTQLEQCQDGILAARKVINEGSSDSTAAALMQVNTTPCMTGWFDEYELQESNNG